LDDQLRIAIDRLVRDGGRLTVDAAAGETSVILDQPGSRFGILEVNGRVLLASTEERTASDLAAAGWSDPTVTLRLGREIRLPRADPGAEAPITLTRTWRVPPSLAAEIADAVRAVLGEVGSLDFRPVHTREPSAVDAVRSPRPPIEDEDIDQPHEDRPAGRMVPAPLKGILALVLVGVVGFVWAGMIRGAPRVPPPSSGPSPSQFAAGASAAAPATPSASAAAVSAMPSASAAAVSAMPSASAAASEPSLGPIRSPVVSASTEDDAGPAAAAIDGDPATAWHAAFGVPQWIEVGLGMPTTVNEVVLVIAQSENGPTRHMIQIALTGQPLQVVGVVSRRTTDGDALVFRPDDPIEDVERIRIETLASPSNAGWYEVIVR
jgi:F5/8 type C domain